MWRFVALLLFFVLVLIAAYWFVLLPDHWTARRKGRGRDDEREGHRGWRPDAGGEAHPIAEHQQRAKSKKGVADA